MNAQQTSQAQEIFGEAMELPAADRQAFIERACGPDADVLHEVRTLLASIVNAGRFLTAPTADGQSELLTAASGIISTLEEPGTRIGRYKLLQLIGEGGFGSVFMAEQEQPVRRQVALKIIKLGMDTKQVIARFEAERQALAMMDHPSIARVFDAGATDTGRPYFVMELVRGVPITTYCDDNNLSTTDRLKLFVEVCQAVQHAHQKGVIHRDLKPSNVLVTVHHDKPVPKVIDFGIAKATNARLTERTLFTEFRQFVGTPQYMSPEQAQFNGIDIDTRSDVYSLGVLLYELLTGTTPFDPKELRGAGYDEIGRLIREAEPPRPSTRLSALGESLPTVAAQRRTDAHQLAELMRGELDWVVMRCLEKDRTRRYDTASGLAADVKRHLMDEPVLARPTSAGYRLRKFVRRNKRTAAAVSIAAGGLIIGSIAASYGLYRAMHDRDIAVNARIGEAAQRAAAEHANGIAQEQRAAALTQEAAARTEAAKVQAVNQFLQGLLASPRPEIALGEPVRIRDVLDRAAKSLDAGDFKQPAEVEASVRQTLGQSYWSLGEYQAAETQHRKALALAQASTGKESSLVAGILIDLSRAVGWGGDRDSAVTIAREALRIEKKANGPVKASVAVATENLATNLTYVNQNDEAGELGRTAMQMRLKLGDRESLATAFDMILAAMTMPGDSPEKVDLLRQALAIQRKQLSPDHVHIAHTLHNLGEVFAEQEKLQDAKAALEESLAIKRKVLPTNHPDIEASLSLLCSVLDELNDWPALQAVLIDHYDWITKYDRTKSPIDDMQRLVVVCNALNQPDAVKAWRDRLQVSVVQRLAALSVAINEHPEDAALVQSRAMLEARFGRYREAADDFGAAIKLHPENNDNWYYRGCLLAYLNDAGQYRAACAGMLSRFADSTDASTLDRTAKTCSLLPGIAPVSESADPLTLANRALASAGNDVEKLAWFNLCRGIALYRHADYPASVQPLERALDPPNASRIAMAKLFLAMSEQHLGQEKLADAAMTSARQAMDSRFPTIEGAGIGADLLEEWLMCQVARREAEQLLAAR